MVSTSHNLIPIGYEVSSFCDFSTETPANIAWQGSVLRLILDGLNAHRLQSRNSLVEADQVFIFKKMLCSMLGCNQSLSWKTLAYPLE